MRRTNLTQLKSYIFRLPVIINIILLEIYHLQQNTCHLTLLLCYLPEVLYILILSSFFLSELVYLRSATVPCATTAPLDFTLCRIKSQWHYRRMDVKLLTLLAALTAVMYAPPSQGMTLFSDLLCVSLAQVYLDFFLFIFYVFAAFDVN